jgi:hypothetical protein
MANSYNTGMERLTSEQMLVRINKAIPCLPSLLGTFAIAEVTELASETGTLAAVESECYYICCAQVDPYLKTVGGKRSRPHVRFVSFYVDEHGDEYQIEDDCLSVEDALFSCWVFEQANIFTNKVNAASMHDDIQWQKDNAAEIKKVLDEGKRQMGG